MKQRLPQTGRALVAQQPGPQVNEACITGEKPALSLVGPGFVMPGGQRDGENEQESGGR